MVSQQLMMQRKGEKMGRFHMRGSPEGHGVVAFGQTKLDIIRQILRADGLQASTEATWLHCLSTSQTVLSGGPSATSVQSSSHPSAQRRALTLSFKPSLASGCSHCFHPHQSHGCHPTREQVEGKNSIILTFRQLMAEEGPWGLMKGLSARSSLSHAPPPSSLWWAMKASRNSASDLELVDQDTGNQ